MISAVIITFNEEKNIERCLYSIKDVVDEIIVVDSFSVDNTVKICEKFGAKVFQVSWMGFSQTKNYANKLASNNYILSIDADEALSTELIQSILNVKRNLYGAFSFNRITNYCGKWIKYSGWYPDIKLRLFPKSYARWEGSYVHEKLVLLCNLPITHLKGNLLHYSISSVEDHKKRIEYYSSLQAKQLLENRAKFHLLKFFFAPLTKFIKHYFIKLGFLDGFAGLQIAFFTALATYKKYKKYRLLLKGWKI